LKVWSSSLEVVVVVAGDVEGGMEDDGGTEKSAEGWTEPSND